MSSIRFPRFRVAFAAVTATVLLAGCALLGRVGFEEPVVDLKSLRLTGLGISGGSMVLVLDVHNPNAYELRGLAIQANLTLEETDFGALELDRGVVLPPEAHTEVEVPMRFTWEGVGAAARGLLTQGSVRYQLGGRFLVDTPLGDQWVGITRSGMVGIADVM